MMLWGNIDDKFLSPLKTGFLLRYNNHRASSPATAGQLYASSNKFDKRTQTRRFEALASLDYKDEKNGSKRTTAVPVLTYS